MNLNEFQHVLGIAVVKRALESSYRPSPAEQLLDLAKSLEKTERCGCLACIRVRRDLESQVPEQFRRLARALAAARPSSQFRAMFEEWTAKQIAEHLGVNP